MTGPLVWTEKPSPYGGAGYEGRLGRFVVAATFYSAFTTKGDPNVIGARCGLPGLHRDNHPRFKGHDDARAYLERKVELWLAAAGLTAKEGA